VTPGNIRKPGGSKAKIGGWFDGLAGWASCQMKIAFLQRVFQSAARMHLQFPFTSARAGNKSDLPHALLLGLLALLPVCGCSLVNQVGESTKAIKANRVAVANTTEGIQKNAQAIGESTSSITANRDAVEASSQSINSNRAAVGASSLAIRENSSVINQSSQAIAGNESAVESSSRAIKTNELVIAQSTRAIAENEGAVQSSSRAIVENRLAVEQSTAAIVKNSQALDEIVAKTNELKANQSVVVLIAVAVLALLLAPSVLALIVLWQTRRLVKLIHQQQAELTSEKRAQPAAGLKSPR